MSAVATEFVKELSAVRWPGDFFTFGTAEILAPRLEVDGVGVIALPLLPVQAAELVGIAERAPYGRGADTLIDAGVRRTWQISAGRVHIDGKQGAATLQAILARVAEGLGVSEPITAELYRLLVYDQSSLFVSRRDTEKAPCIATLVLALLSVSTGGELAIRHKNREARLDLKCEEASEAAAFGAFYANRGDATTCDREHWGNARQGGPLNEDAPTPFQPRQRTPRVAPGGAPPPLPF